MTAAILVLKRVSLIPVTLVSIYSIMCLNGVAGEDLTSARVQDACCKTKSCIAFSSASSGDDKALEDLRGCLRHSTCRLLVSYQGAGKNGINANENSEVRVQLLAPTQGNAYISFALSTDKNMGDDVVVSCIKFGSSSQIVLGMNKGRDNVKVDTDPANVFRPVSIAEEDGHLLCEFDLRTTFHLDAIPIKHQFDLLSKEYVILLATGVPAGEDRIAYHGFHKYLSTDTGVDLQNHSSCTVVPNKYRFQKDVVTAHLVMMVFAFITFLPTGILIARFLKKSYVRVHFWSRRLWFWLHVLNQGLSLLLVTLGIVVMEGYFGFFNRHMPRTTAHYMIGVAVGLLLVVNVIQGGLKTQCNTRETWTGLPKSHWFIGVLSFSLGVIQIFLTPFLLPEVIDYCALPSYLTLAWAVFFLLTYFLLSYFLYHNEKMEHTLGLDVHKTVSLASYNSNVDYFKGEHFPGIFPTVGNTGSIHPSRVDHLYKSIRAKVERLRLKSNGLVLGKSNEVGARTSGVRVGISSSARKRRSGQRSHNKKVGPRKLSEGKVQGTNAQDASRRRSEQREKEEDTRRNGDKGKSMEGEGRSGRIGRKGGRVSEGTQTEGGQLKGSADKDRSKSGWKTTGVIYDGTEGQVFRMVPQRTLKWQSTVHPNADYLEFTAMMDTFDQPRDGFLVDVRSYSSIVDVEGPPEPKRALLQCPFVLYSRAESSETTVLAAIIAIFFLISFCFSCLLSFSLTSSDFDGHCV